jgi:dTDP-glucose 4,6-dehydratase
LLGLPYKVYLRHHRTSLFIADAVSTLCNIVDRFQPGEVYNIGGSEYHDMKEVSDLILRQVGRNDSIVEYVEQEPWTTHDKKVDIRKATLYLGHHPKTSLATGIAQTLEWMKAVYLR